MAGLVAAPRAWRRSGPGSRTASCGTVGDSKLMARFTGVSRRSERVDRATPGRGAPRGDRCWRRTRPPSAGDRSPAGSGATTYPAMPSWSPGRTVRGWWTSASPSACWRAVASLVRADALREAICRTFSTLVAEGRRAANGGRPAAGEGLPRQPRRGRAVRLNQYSGENRMPDERAFPNPSGWGQPGVRTPAALSRTSEYSASTALPVLLRLPPLYEAHVQGQLRLGRV